MPVLRSTLTPAGVLPRRVAGAVGYGSSDPNNPAQYPGGAQPYIPPATVRPGSSSSAAGKSGFDPIKNPWEDAMRANYGAAGEKTYGADWKSAVAQGMALGGRDYEGDLRRFSQEDVARQNTAADNQLGALGMRELSLRTDIQADRSKNAADASTRAMIDSQGIKANALQTMQGMLSAASGVELQRISSMINAASAGAQDYQNITTNIANPLQDKLASTMPLTGRQVADRNARSEQESLMANRPLTPAELRQRRQVERQQRRGH